MFLDVKSRPGVPFAKESICHVCIWAFQLAFSGGMKSSAQDDTKANASTPLPRLAPYERRVIELLRNSKDKRARKLAKKRVCQILIPCTLVLPQPYAV